LASIEGLLKIEEPILRLINELKIQPVDYSNIKF